MWNLLSQSVSVDMFIKCWRLNCPLLALLTIYLSFNGVLSIFSCVRSLFDKVLWNLFPRSLSQFKGSSLASGLLCFQFWQSCGIRCFNPSLSWQSPSLASGLGLWLLWNFVVPTTTTWWGSPESPKQEEQSQTAQKQTPEKEHTQTNNLTRFGLNAYVPGAIKKRD